MLKQSIRALVAATAMLVALLGVFASAAAQPEPGVGVSDDETTITQVQPGSPVWRDGIRVGQRVIELRDAATPTGWHLLVQDGDMRRETSQGAHVERLRAALPASIFGVGAALLGIVLVLRGYLFGFALQPLGVAVATTPLLMTGNVRDTLAGGIASFLIGSVAVLYTARSGRAHSFALGSGIAFAVLWALSVLGRPTIFDAVDAARIPTTAGFGLWATVTAVDWSSLKSRLAGPGAPVAFDVLYLPVVFAGLAAAVLFAEVPLVVALAVGSAAVLMYPFWRRTVARAFERLVIGRVRRSAEIRAVEEERGRLAREIHDAPLQDLAAVILRLDELPGAARETSALRDVASRLRDVAAALHPPVLEDLGLAAALNDLGDAIQAEHPDWGVAVEVDDLTVEGMRPEPDVELATFRIAQEAVGNALRHSQGLRVSLVGSIARDAIELTVSDDGVGVSSELARQARGRGHFGLDSMRGRADSVGGRLALESDETGTRVRFVWEREA